VNWRGDGIPIKENETNKSFVRSVLKKKKGKKKSLQGPSFHLTLSEKKKRSNN
jgi:hypothetical protein